MRAASIFTFYTSQNLGDLLIARNVTKLFNERFECNFCDIGSCIQIDIEKWHAELESSKPIKQHNSKKGIKAKLLSIPLVRTILGYVKSKFSKADENASSACIGKDIAIFAGGNSLMELYFLPSTTYVFYKIVKKLKKEGKKVAFCFCGVGPLKTRCNKRMGKKVLELIDFISVRDMASYRLVKDLVPHKEVEIWRDPVFLETFSSNEKKTKIIGINVYFGPDRRLHDDVKNGFVKLIKYIKAVNINYKIKLFSSELTDISDILSIKAEFEHDDDIVVENIQTINDLFEIYKSIDAILATRMHTAITSIVSKKPIIALSWQAKVTSLMEYFENQENCFDISYFAKNPEIVAKKLLSCLNNGENIINENQKILNLTRTETIKKLDEFVLRM